MKKIGVLAAVMAMAFLFAGVASAEMYVEGYLGAAQASNLNLTTSITDVIAQPGGNLWRYDVGTPGKTDVAVLGGLKVGTWFVPEGFAGLNYPSWMKYFGFYTDFSYQRLYMRNQTLTGVDFFPANGNTPTNGIHGQIESNGMVATWAFMFAGRYGFFPDSEVPFGRLQPYVAVGPAIMFSSMKPKIRANEISLVTGLPTGFILQQSQADQSSTNICLAVDAGIRYMCLKNVSIDLSFKYRYAQPSYTFSGIDLQFIHSDPATFKLNPVYSLFSGQLGVAYQF